MQAAPPKIGQPVSISEQGSGSVFCRTRTFYSNLNLIPAWLYGIVD
ncbi:hypothetical protein NMH_1044 [Neisseria meningitidis H44/76]|uniref:Uncharacterized protein n=1 Tax=Neisseria meningitidis serogroup B / serotype 15 (strain H44/76) TaxID=909420 RepID=E6MWK4_NEIMH|nr:hypothetical protein NMH_1044 [Neisseria meningitidis H44/76]KER38525.1 hypothetical protein F528_2536 [Neisseria meningitidis 992008]